MCPTVAKLRCDISAHGLHSHLQTAITFPFQIQIKYRLKLWTRDFPRFQMRYCMNNLNFGKWSRCVQQFPKWGAAMKLGFFTFWDFVAISQPFCSCEMRVTVLRNGTRVPKVLSQPWNPLRNGTFVAKSTFFTSQCVSQLRNRCSCVAKWHSCAKIGFAAAKIFAERAIGLRANFAAKSRQWNLFFRCSLVG